MREVRQKYDWQHTSYVLSMLYNINRDPKTPARGPDDFNPFIKKTSEQSKVLMVPFSTLRAVFVPDSIPKP